MRFLCFQGIGLNDMFLFLSSLAATYDVSGSSDPEIKVKMTMRSIGVGVTITFLTDLITFVVGTWSPFPAVRNFCIFTGKL